MFFLIQPIDFHSLEIAARDNAPDSAALHNGDMTEAASTHRPERVNGAMIRRNRGGVRCHRPIEARLRRIVALCEGSDSIALKMPINR